MTLPITLVFSDGAACKLSAQPGQKLIEVAIEAGLNLLTDCSNGQCGTCIARLVSGGVDMDDYDQSVLPDEDRADGSVLPCVCRVTGSCAIELPYESTEALSQEPGPVPGEVVEVEAVAAETMRLRVHVDREIDFEPGQYVRIRPQGPDVWRSYSMANLPGEDTLDFFIRMVPGGAFSGWLASAKAGNAVEISVPHGTFFLREEQRPRLFVAGGTGVAPFLSMLRTLASREPVVPTTVLIGARTPRHLFALDELDTLRAAIPGLEVRLAVEQDAAAGCHHGYATDLIPGLGLAPDTRVYLCGPPPMVEAGRRAAEAAGLPRNDVLCERFA
jgi:3-phenylpropionate/trans-cinnamate dioxygenase ferredoxin reductase subunit/benzoate/toluate 1,2-dioxygenase reductase subunit